MADSLDVLVAGWLDLHKPQLRVGHLAETMLIKINNRATILAVAAE
jgi:hypothetical protein